MSDKNLKKIDLSHEEAVENGRKGGIASGKARKKRIEIKKTLQDLLDGTYKDSKGEAKQGIEILAITLFKIANDPKHKQCIQAQRLIYELTGQDKSDDEKKRLKLANKLTEAEIEKIKKTTENIGW